MNKRAQAYSDYYSAKNSNADASLDRSPSPTTAKSGSQAALLNEAEIRARLLGLSRKTYRTYPIRVNTSAAALRRIYGRGGSVTI